MSTRSEPPQSPLRKRQAEQVRATLLDRFLRLTLERGPNGFTMQDVAAAAGVSVRTLYRYFPNREAFTEAAVATTDRALAQRRSAGSGWLDDPDFLADTFEVFAEHGTLMRAALLFGIAGQPSPGRAERTRRIRAAVQRLEGIDPERHPRLVALVRLLASPEAWRRMTEDDLDLDAREAGHAAQWAIRTLLDAARRDDRGEDGGGAAP